MTTKTKIKILFADPSETSGGPRQVGQIILNGLNSEKYDVLLGSPQKNYAINPRIKTKYMPAIHNVQRPKSLKAAYITLKTFPTNVVSLCKFIKSHNIDLIHSNNEICFTTFAAAKLTRTPHVVHVHGLGFSKSIFSQIFAQILNNCSDVIIAVSDSVTEKLEQSGVPSSKIETIYNGIDTDTFSPSTPSLYAHHKFNLPEHCQIITMISALDPRKGHELLIEAANHIKSYTPNVYFLIVGETLPDQIQYKAHLTELIQSYGLEDRVLFTGFQENIRELLNCTSILIQPSLTDAGPLVPLEAMSCGIPVVATNVGGNPEKIINGITGLIVPENDLISLGEAIIKLLNNDEFRQEMGNNARKWVKSKFDSRALIDNIEYVYDTLMNKPKDTNIN